MSSGAFSYFDTRELGHRLYMILTDFDFNDSTFGCIRAKQYFQTDYASIDVLHNIWLFVFYALLAGYGDKAATIHDWLYSGYGIERDDGTVYYPTRYEADQVLYRALRAEGIARWRAWLFYVGVRVGGKNSFCSEQLIFTYSLTA